MSIKHPCTKIDGNAVAARNIARSIIGKGCDYADGRKNGVRYKWMFRRYNMTPIGVYRDQIENALSMADIKNYSVAVHADKWANPAISVTLMAV